MNVRSCTVVVLAWLVCASFLLVPLQARQNSASGPGSLGPKDGFDLAPADLNRVKVGDPAPDFTLEDADSRPVTLSQYRDNETVLLIFYRGYW